MARELILMSPYTPPAQHALSLGADDAACWLNAWTALWHPAALANAKAPPRWVGPYDLDRPGDGWLVAQPETPPLQIAPDFNDRLHAAGGMAFRASPDRAATVGRLFEAIGADDGRDPRPWFGLGFGYLVLDALFEAMERDRTLDREGFWADVQSSLAAADPEPHLRAAAEKLLQARETLYPAPVWLLDFAVINSSETAAAALQVTSPINLIGVGRDWQTFFTGGLLDQLRQQTAAASDPYSAKSQSIEICAGNAVIRADDLLPHESQFWNLRRGREIVRDLFQCSAEVFAQATTVFHAQSPQILSSAGIARCVLAALDDNKLPVHGPAIVQWPAKDGRQVEAYTRTPLPADEPETFFNLAHTLHKTIMNDSTATLPFVRRDRPAAEWLTDWHALSALAPVLGQWSTLSFCLRDSVIGGYSAAATADEFAVDHLHPAINPSRAVSGFARHWRRRRQVDAAWTWLGLLRSLGGDDAHVLNEVDRWEATVETGDDVDGNDETAAALAQRIVRSAGNGKGLLLMNPCGFARRAALELDDGAMHVQASGPIRAVQRDGSQCRLVVDVPSFGFTWVPLPREPAPSVANKPSHLRLADESSVRNEFFEAEIDAATGGLRALRDLRTRENRVGLQLVYQPGSTMKADSIAVTANGPALGEIVAEGAILDEHQERLARFRVRYRAWALRPVLELRIELTLDDEPRGDPWHAYFGARFAWRDERATLLRSNAGVLAVTTHSRPVTPECLELRSGRLRTQILPLGLPFHQRHGGRMLDVVLLPPGETARRFDLAVALDRDHPLQTAWGLLSPIATIPVDRGPPSVGPSGWLAHLDAANLLVTSLRPDGDRPAIVIRLLEIGGVAGGATLRFARNPRSAELLEPDGSTMMPLTVQDDAVPFDFAAHDWLEMRVEF